MTKQRALVLKIVRSAQGHLTAEEIFGEAKKELPGIALATVYNSLSYLCENGMIEKISIKGQTDRYDKMLVRHDHRLCDRCGAISDVIIDGLHEYIEKRNDAGVTSYDLTVHSLCPACRAAVKQ